MCALCTTMPLIGSPAALVICSHIPDWGWLSELKSQSCKALFLVGRGSTWSAQLFMFAFVAQYFFLRSFSPTFCILHNILFISVDELNDTIAANLNDTEFYGGELW